MINADFVERCIKAAEMGHSKLSDLALSIPGMTDLKTKHLLNNLCDHGASYLEIGTLMGATVSAAAFGNTGKFYAVDDFSQWPIVSKEAFAHLNEEFALFQAAIDKPTREVWENHLQILGIANQVTLIEQDCFQWEPSFEVDIFFYDGDHSAESTKIALAKFVPLLKPSLLLVDDFVAHDVRRGLVGAGLSFENGWELPYWNGLFIGLLDAVS